MISAPRLIGTYAMPKPSGPSDQTECGIVSQMKRTRASRLFGVLLAVATAACSYPEPHCWRNNDGKRPQDCPWWMGASGPPRGSRGGA